MASLGDLPPLFRFLLEKIGHSSEEHHPFRAKSAILPTAGHSAAGGRSMGWRIYSIMAGLLISQQVMAADRNRSERDRQISEIVFQNYPPRAFAAGEEGPVFFTVTLDKDAHPTSCQVTHGSGHPLLDDETCKLIVQHAVFNSARDANGRLVRQTTEGVVNWTLPGHTPAAISFSPAATAAATSTEPQVCKKTLRAGTLSAYERTCMSRSEWAHQSDEQKQTYEELQGRRGSTHCTILIGGAGTGVVGSGTPEASPDC